MLKKDREKFNMLAGKVNNGTTKLPIPTSEQFSLPTSIAECDQMIQNLKECGLDIVSIFNRALYAFLVSD